ncbi:MAG: S41 family peptidase [Bacteroidia bacterium]|nr:S41 family peptidase [Bacteroidia bacterium]
MKKILLLFLLFQSGICLSQTEIEKLLDSVISRVKQTSMYASKVNWDSLPKQVHLKAQKAQNLADLKPALEALLNGTGDYHSKIMDAQNYTILAAFTDYKNIKSSDTRPRKQAHWQAVNDTAIHFEFKMLCKNVAYLKIVGIAPNVNIESESRKIRAAVIAAAKQNPKGWIIDLRYNGGGNMNPMMAGIGPLVGDGLVGKLVGPNGEVQFNWEISKGNFIYNRSQIVDLPNQPKFKHRPKIAVLTSRYTVSSGELVATTLKGRTNTKFFGEATGCYATNVNWEVIDDKIILNVSTGIFCDRNSIAYPVNIPVDEEIPFEIVNDSEQDPCVKEAMKWLLKK